MAGETIITVIGNLTADPELRFTPSGAAVANFTIASTPRTFDRQANEFKDGETLFLRSSVWRETAENVAETLTKGMRVIAQGRLVSRSFQTKEGENRTVNELQVDEIGPSLRYASAKVTRNQRRDGSGGGTAAIAHGQQTYGAGNGYGTAGPAQQDGWNATPATNGGWGQQAPQQQPPAPAQGSGWPTDQGQQLPTQNEPPF